MPAKRKQTIRKTVSKRPAKKVAKKAAGRSVKAKAKSAAVQTPKVKRSVLKTHGPKVYVISGGELRASHSHRAAASSARALVAQIGIDRSEYSAIRKKVLAAVPTSLFGSGKK